MNSDFIAIMTERGFLHQCTDIDAFRQKLAAGTVTCYTGYDATARSLHVGSLLSIMMMRWFQKCGHKPIVLMGGGTTKVGDPSGKDESRKMLTAQDIDNNIAGIRKVFEKFLSFGNGKTDAVMVNNADWLEKLNYIDFLRDYGTHFTINRMMAFDSVKTRLEREQPLTFLEFNYMILQAYDFLELNRQYGCVVQFGGSDQWGNIVNGIELARRIDRAELYGFTTPLLTTASGAKMGKTAAGAVWLNEDMLNAYDYYQFWRNTEDADVGRMLKYYTELPMDEIARLEALKGTEINEAKKILAFEATQMCHGRQAATEAAETARKTFEEGASAEGLPTLTLSRRQLTEGIPAFVLFKDAGLATSGGEARRLIAGGGARVNDVKVEDDQQIISIADLNDDQAVKLSAGKKKHALVTVTD